MYYLIDKCGISKEILLTAVENGDLEVFKYLLKNSKTYWSNVTVKASECNQLEMLKYLYKESCFS